MSAHVYADMAPRVFSIWQNYWNAAGYAAPPLVVHKPTISGGVTLLAPLGSPWVRQFVQSHETDPDFLFENQGEVLAETNPRYLGVSSPRIRIRRQGSMAPDLGDPANAEPDGARPGGRHPDGNPRR
jgi:hypothetical protein